MYAIAQRPRNATRLTGVVAAALFTIGAGYVFSDGMRQDIIPVFDQRTELVMIAPEQELLPLPVEKPEPVEEVKIAAPELFAPDIPFVPEVPVITAPPAPEVPVAPEPAPGPVSLAGSDRIPPKLRTGRKPDYPAASIRASEQGTTQLEVCVTDKGRVQSVSVVRSSGFPRLDDAAVNWLRNERFTPGMVGGKPQPMCGHSVYYQWDLKNA